MAPPIVLSLDNVPVFGSRLLLPMGKAAPHTGVSFNEVSSYMVSKLKPLFLKTVCRCRFWPHPKVAERDTNRG